MIVIVILLLPLDSFACRCQQLPLSDYFLEAEFVAMAKLKSATEESEQRVLEFELMAAPYKGGANSQGMGSIVHLATPLSTASCGIQPDLSAIYVVFATSASEDDNLLSVNSCNGTRVHISTQLDEPVGFIDVPARFVAGQLNALFGMEVLRDVSANAPRPTDPDNNKLVGLLDIRSLAHGGFARVYREPSLSSVVIKDVQSYEDIESREYAYEQPGAVVFAKLPGWFRVRVNDGEFGWLSADDAGTWFPYDQLPVRRLAYLGDEWSGLTWPDAGAGIPMRKALNPGDGRQEYPVNVLESAEIGGMPWFRVEVLRTDPCSSSDAGGPGFAGWVPAYGRRGNPTVWFYSRGC